MNAMRDYLPLVNILQGTASDVEYSTGNTLPLIARPFGLHHWSLQTAQPHWFFHPDHRKLWGIRLTHQPSPWMGDYGCFLVTPFTGPALMGIDAQASAYRRREMAPNSLAVDLLRYGIYCDMTPSQGGAIFRFTSTLEESLKVRFNFEAGFAIDARGGTVIFSGKSTQVRSGSQANFALHFRGEFSEAPIEFTPLEKGGYWTFAPGARQVELRVAASFISASMAEVALDRELRERSLEEIREEGAEIWNGLLGRIEIDSESERQLRTFYSCLYRSLLFPRLLDEIDAEGETVHYSPYDGGIHAGSLCTDNGFWDTYRTVYPLLALVYPDKLNHIMRGWVAACREAGWAPKWPSPGLVDCMIGTHFNAVVADCVAHGVTDWDVETAYRYIWQDATVPSKDGAYGRQGLGDYLELGYLPAERHHASVSATLDYAYDDFCVRQVALYLGREEEAARLLPRTQYYRNVFDPEVGFMRERLADGSWQEPFREFQWGGGFVEGGTWQHSFNVPHDPEGLAALWGGPERLCRKLDTMLATPPRFEAGSYGQEIHEMTEMALADFGQYAHSNQPVHGYLFLYALMGQPEKTSYWVRRVTEELYSPEVFPADEDNGEMAAWYVWATLGLYPQCPGKPGYVHFAPLVHSARVRTATGVHELSDLKSGLPPLK